MTSFRTLVLRSPLGIPLALFVLALTAGGSAFAAPAESVLWSFGNGTDGAIENGAQPYALSAGLVMDSKGNLFGTTPAGGINNAGTVFEISPPATPGGEWTESVIWNFGPTPADGEGPRAGLVIDRAGNLCGVTFTDTAFELSPPSTPGGEWTHSIIWDFNNGADAENPQVRLAIDSNGNLYGTTFRSANAFGGEGTVYEIRPPATGGDNWTGSVIWNFNYTNTPQGFEPNAGVIADQLGNLYGTTFEGGATSSSSYGLGTVFELSPPATGSTSWTESILWNFQGPAMGDGEYPQSTLTMDAKGNLYGTSCGQIALEINSYACVGTVFELSPPTSKGGSWRETNLWTFSDQGTGGYAIDAGVIMDSSGNLYGVTQYGGTYGYGTLFKLSPSSTGKWTNTVLWNFGKGVNKKGIGKDGASPEADLVMDAMGNIYSTTQKGGLYGLGTVFQVSKTGATP